MKIDGKVHLFFEQSGTFKNEFKKLGYKAFDYDIQDNFNETDNVIDLFNEIEKGYAEEPSIFDNITQDDLIIAFFPCIHFCGLSQALFSLTHHNYVNLTIREKFEKILEKNRNRMYFFELLNKLICICLEKNIRLIFENPWQGQTLLRVFLKQPDIIDNNRMLRGDFMIKPTAYWFFNCKATYGESFQKDKKRIAPTALKPVVGGGLCSEERSMISPDYARNFICDFILGKAQESTLQKRLF